MQVFKPVLSIAVIFSCLEAGRVYINPAITARMIPTEYKTLYTWGQAIGFVLGLFFWSMKAVSLS